MHFQAGDASTETYSLFAPADIAITSISRGTGFTQDPQDYTIYFALCKDVIGYYNHVKELSPELPNIFISGTCKQNPNDTTYTYCENSLNRVNAGTLVGKVGRLQGKSGRLLRKYLGESIVDSATSRQMNTFIAMSAIPKTKEYSYN